MRLAYYPARFIDRSRIKVDPGTEWDLWAEGQSSSITAS
jgi:hypothetical protein